MTTTQRSTKETAGSGKPSDAIALLKADHDKVKKLFKQFERLHEDEADDEAARVAGQICRELTVHTTLEEEIFYPAVRAAIHDADMMDEAMVEHASAKELIGQIESMQPDDDQYAAKVIVLGEYINHHVDEEQDEMFPKVRKAKVDLKDLGERMLARKQELQAENGSDDDVDLVPPTKPARKRAGAHAGRD